MWADTYGVWSEAGNRLKRATDPVHSACVHAGSGLLACAHAVSGELRLHRLPCLARTDAQAAKGVIGVGSMTTAAQQPVLLPKCAWSGNGGAVLMLERAPFLALFSVTLL